MYSLLPVMLVFLLCGHSWQKNSSSLLVLLILAVVALLRLFSLFPSSLLLLFVFVVAMNTFDMILMFTTTTTRVVAVNVSCSYCEHCYGIHHPHVRHHVPSPSSYHLIMYHLSILECRAPAHTVGESGFLMALIFGSVVATDG